jgi:hypothetical protein
MQEGEPSICNSIMVTRIKTVSYIPNKVDLLAAATARTTDAAKKR